MGIREIKKLDKFHKIVVTVFREEDPRRHTLRIEDCYWKGNVRRNSHKMIFLCCRFDCGEG